jgi:hypothetical protein
MKYLVMVQGTQADYEGMQGKGSAHAPAWSEQELQAMYAYMGAINDDLSKSGELVDGQGLAERHRPAWSRPGRTGRPSSPTGRTARPGS